MLLGCLNMTSASGTALQHRCVARQVTVSLAKLICAPSMMVHVGGRAKRYSALRLTLF